MSHPLGFEEGSGKYSPSFTKCTHGVFVTSDDQASTRSSVCSICRSTDQGSPLRRSKAVSKTKLRKIEAQLPQPEDRLIETRAATDVE